MSNESYEDFQYDSCVSRGICSINPRISALQTVLVLYLRIIAKYSVRIIELENIDEGIKSFILNILASSIYNPEFNDSTFEFVAKHTFVELPKIMDKYAQYYPNDEMEEEKKKVFELFSETSDITSAIKYGEKIFRRAQEQIPVKIRDLYNILLFIAKSLSINLLELKSFEKDYNEGFVMILEILDKINLKENDFDILKKIVIKSSEIDITLTKILRAVQEERYGEQRKTEVSFSTYPSKAVLVVGSNIRELETILDALKQDEIDIYTHDDMMIAHTFPKFAEYENLKGQFGQGIESCLLDFATFPGPIILTKHSLHNIENFYRGILYTTDYTSPKGVMKIVDDDFSDVIKSAKLAKGFKTGKQCESVSVGFDFDEVIEEIVNKIESKSYKKIFFIGLDGYSLEQKSYFEKLIKRTPEDVLIISFTYYSDKENLIFINTCFDFFSLIKIYDYVKEFKLPTIVFIPKCNNYSISQMIYISNDENTDVFIGKCTPIVLNPSLMNTLQKTFKIRAITSVKNDLDLILNI